MRRPWSGDESLLEKLTDNPRARFRAWRKPRPVVGGVLLVIGGLLIGYVPIQFASELMLIGGTFTVIGLLFSALVTFCGVGVLAKPRLSTIFGVFGIAFSTLSLFGALGGLFVGMIVGTVGGVLSYAWEPPEGYEYREPALNFQRTGFIWQEASEFIWHAGPQVEQTGGDDADAAAEESTPATDETLTGGDPVFDDGATGETATADGTEIADDAPTDAVETTAAGQGDSEAVDEASDETPPDEGGAGSETGVDDDTLDRDTDEFDWDGDDEGTADESDDEDADNGDEADEAFDWDETDVVDDRFEL